MTISLKTVFSNSMSSPPDIEKLEEKIIFESQQIECLINYINYNLNFSIQQLEQLIHFQESIQKSTSELAESSESILSSDLYKKTNQLVKKGDAYVAKIKSLKSTINRLQTYKSKLLSRSSKLAAKRRQDFITYLESKKALKEREQKLLAKPSKS